MWVCWLYRPNFDLSGRISANRLYFRKIYPYNSFPLKTSALIRISSLCSSNFPSLSLFVKIVTLLVWREVLRDEFLFIFWIEHDHIFFPVISWPILLRSRFYPHIFLKIPQNRVLPLFNIVVRSYSGWVLMVLKVLSSKSLKSRKNFKYLHRTHIFNSSWYILHFLPKTPPIVCYVSMHHM